MSRPSPLSSGFCHLATSASALAFVTSAATGSNSSPDELVAGGSPEPATLHQHGPLTASPLAGGIRIEQFVHNVLDFSSQYGSDSSISFTVQNITGRPSKFPAYGDFPETFAMRCYGPWPARAPSYRAEIMPQTVEPHSPQDYIILEFEEYVWPSRISIFETYNPGAVCQIWALNLHRWQLLWKHNAEDGPHQLPPADRQRSRIFSPPLAACETPTRCVRLEFHHRHLDYYAELDAVLLVGRRVTDGAALRRAQQQALARRRLGRIQRGLDAAAFQAQPAANAGEANALMDQFLCNELERFEVHSAGGDGDEAEEEEMSAADRTIGGGSLVPRTCIQMMPHEILLHIAGYLDLISMCRLAATCRLLRSVACDPHLYQSLNVRPYWAQSPATSALLDHLRWRCPLLRSLDLSWTCTPFAAIQPPEAVRFILDCGRNLTRLRLNSCASLTAQCLATVVRHCPRLHELAVRNFREAPLVTAEQLAPLRQLRRLDLYHTGFATEVLCALLAANGELRHLNLGHGSTQTNMDAVAVQLSRTNGRLRSLDMWKSYGLSAMGLAALAECAVLEELDIGWCLRDESALGDSLQMVLAGDCGPVLRRLGLASIRGLGADDLDCIAQRCARVEQLELMGIRGVSADKCLEILHHCRHLEMLDLSFCDSLDIKTVTMFRDRYPLVAIKWSFVTGDESTQ